MPSSNNNKGGDSSNKHEVKLQAVLLADSFTTTFRPMTLDGPKVLCPLNNVVMLDYAIEFLAGAGVEELYIFCVHLAVQEYIERESLVVQNRMSIHVVRDSSCTNAGDALRELDKRNVIQSNPFILMSGDIITNVDLIPAMKQHKERYLKDNSAIMTLLFQRVRAWSLQDEEEKVDVPPLVPLHKDLMVGLAGPNQRIVMYDSHVSQGVCPLPTSFFYQNQGGGLTIRRDLMDTGIAICSPDVLARFSDEFDYRHVYSQFVANSVAEEEDGLQNRIHAHLLQGHEYAAQIHDPKTYHAVSQDLLRRWCYPLVPDNLPSGYDKLYRYQLRHRNQYRECKQPSTVGRSTKIQSTNTTFMMGAQVTIGEHCLIKGNTVLAHHVTIHDHVTIADSHLWSNVTIEHGATIEQSILCQNVIVRAGATISKGCIIGQGCIVGKDMTLPPFTRLTLCPKDVEENDDDDDLFDDDTDYDDSTSSSDDDHTNDNHNNSATNIISSHDVVGLDGLGRVWKPPTSASPYDVEYDSEDDDDDDSDSEDDDEHRQQLRKIIKINSQSMGYDPTNMLTKRLQQQQHNMDIYDEYQSEEEEDDDDNNHSDQPTLGDHYNMSSSYANNNNTTHNNDMLSSLLDYNVGAGTTTTITGAAGVPIVGRTKGMDVIKQFKTICLEHDITSPIENLAIELNSFKFSQNATFADVIIGSVQAILQRLPWTTSIQDSPKQLLVHFQKELVHWKPLLQKMAYSLYEEKCILTTLEDIATIAADNSNNYNVMSKEPAFRFLLQTLHDQEVVTEEAILSWAQDNRCAMQNDPDQWPTTIKGKLFLQKLTQDFLQWLEEDSESDSSDDDDSSSD